MIIILWMFRPNQFFSVLHTLASNSIKSIPASYTNCRRLISDWRLTLVRVLNCVVSAIIYLKNLNNCKFLHAPMKHYVQALSVFVAWAHNLLKSFKMPFWVLPGQIWRRRRRHCFCCACVCARAFTNINEILNKSGGVKLEWFERHGTPRSDNVLYSLEVRTDVIHLHCVTKINANTF